MQSVEQTNTETQQESPYRDPALEERVDHKLIAALPACMKLAVCKLLDEGIQRESIIEAAKQLGGGVETVLSLAIEAFLDEELAHSMTETDW